MLIAIALAVVVFSGATLAQAGESENDKPKAQAKKLKSERCPDVRTGISFYRQATWKWQTLMEVPKTKASKARIPASACAYAHHVAKVWMKRSYKARLKYEKHLEFMRKLSDPATAICHVFGSHCQDALGVARCESNLRTWASNGQYQGIFQMGSSERSIYGHSGDALGQAQAAYRYFIASGSDWSPWQCKPSGGLQW